MVPWVELQLDVLFSTGCGFNFIRRVQPKQTRLNVIQLYMSFETLDSVYKSASLENSHETKLHI